MDQFASVFGKEGSLIRLDCRSLEYKYFPFHPVGYKLVYWIQSLSTFGIFGLQQTSPILRKRRRRNPSQSSGSRIPTRCDNGYAERSQRRHQR